MHHQNGPMNLYSNFISRIPLLSSITEDSKHYCLRLYSWLDTHDGKFTKILKVRGEQ
jgi:hypothetical protein